LYAVSLICQKKGLDITSSNLAIEQINEAIDTVNKIVKKRKARVEKQGSTFRVLTFFKDSDTKNLIHHQILGAP
jgi:uncharacterized protein YjgD (DUF1641 family)